MNDYAYWECEREESPTDCGPRRVEHFPELDDEVDLERIAVWLSLEQPDHGPTSASRTG